MWRGGIGSGWVDAPVAVLSGLSPGVAVGLGALLGRTRVYDDAELARRYPGGQAEYAAAFRAATSRARADGFALAEAADELVAVAAAGYPPRVEYVTGGDSRSVAKRQHTQRGAMTH